MAEMVNMVCYQVLGNDVTVATAAEAGQLELNVMMPVIAQNLLVSVGLLTNASRLFADRCVRGIDAERDQIAHWLERSPALVTALAPRIGYAAAAALADEALERGLTVRALVEEKGLLDPETLAAVLDARRMTDPGVPGEH
jgi:aspartate ammonia-lyase